MGKRTSLLTIIFLALGGFMVSCLTPPSYNSTPEIAFLKVSYFDNKGNDSCITTISFKDKEGDLGLASIGSDTSKPYKGDYYFNYWSEMYVKKKGEWKKVIFTGPAFYGRFAPIYKEKPPGPVNGEIDLTFTIPNTTLQSTAGQIAARDTVKFTIQIVDRALHVSNLVETNPFRINLNN